MPLSITPLLTGAALLALLYLIWITMSAIGLRGITIGKPIKEIRQQAGLSLLALTLLSLAILLAYLFLLKAPTTAPLPA